MSDVRLIARWLQFAESAIEQTCALTPMTLHMKRSIRPILTLSQEAAIFFGLAASLFDVSHQFCITSYYDVIHIQL